MFVRLMTKTNHPYNNLSLTREEFNNDYNNMNELITLISYETDNKEDLEKIWLKICNIG